MRKYPIVKIDPKYRLQNLEEAADKGYLAKYWINHPQFGKVLVKLEQETAPAWSEVTAFKIAKLIELPAARYKFGELTTDKTKLILSKDFKDPVCTYIDGDTFLKSNYGSYKYSVRGCLEALDQNNIGLPKGYTIPKGINKGSDLFVGYLLLDYLIANNDRHQGNWEIQFDPKDKSKQLAPVFDNGAGFATGSGSLVYDALTPQEYLDRDVSMFGVSMKEAYHQAKAIKPKAAKIWQEKVKQIKFEKILEIFERIPTSRISTIAKDYAIAIFRTNYNQITAIAPQQQLPKSNSKEIER